MISVLCVDDEPDILNVVKIYLETSGEISVDTVDSAQKAISKMIHSHYDAIVSDYQMPHMDGIEFLKSVRQESDIPFILFTGKGREEVAIEAINNQADFYSIKGGDPKACFDDLMHLIKKAVKRRPMDKGNEFLKKGHLQTAIKYFNKAITIDPDAAESWNNKAIALMKQGKYPDALECFDKALYLNSNFAEAWLNKGYLLGIMNKTEQKSPHDIFISHCVDDAEIAKKICFHLEKQGIKCWIAPRDILPGKIWLDEIPQAIESSQIVLIILSNSSNCSNNVLREIILASEQNKKIIPVRIENIDPSGGLKFLIQIWQYFDAYDSDISNYIDDLTKKLKTTLT